MKTIDNKPIETKEQNVELNENNQKTEIELRDEWLEEARKQTPETIGDFINRLINDYQHDYGTIVRAIAAAACGAAWAVEHSSVGGITGFQASCVKWDFLLGWEGDNYKCGAKFVDYSKMLYPQYQHKFEKTISEETWKSIQKTAQEYLNDLEKEPAHPHVIEHWKHIVAGEVPFGYTVVSDKD